MIKKGTVTLFMVFVLIFLLGIGANAEEYTIGVSLPAPHNQWIAGLTQYVEEEAEDSGDEYEIIITTGEDPSEQVSDVDDLLSQDLDALVLLPIESAPLTPVAEKVYNEHDIPLVIVDRDIRSDTYTSYIGGDNKGIGQAAAHYIGRKLDGEGNVVEILGVPAEITDMRSEGFHETIEEYYPDIEIVADASGDFEREKSLNVMQDILTAHDDIDAVYSHDDEQSIGIATAIQAAGREDEIFVTGAGGNKQVFERLKDSSTDIITATFTYPPTQGASGLRLAKLLVKGEGMPTLLEPTVPRDINLRASEVNADNVDDFYDPDSEY